MRGARRQPRGVQRRGGPDRPGAFRPGRQEPERATPDPYPRHAHVPGVGGTAADHRRGHRGHECGRWRGADARLRLARDGRRRVSVRARGPDRDQPELERDPAAGEHGRRLHGQADRAAGREDAQRPGQGTGPGRLGGAGRQRRGARHRARRPRIAVSGACGENEQAEHQRPRERAESSRHVYGCRSGHGVRRLARGGARAASSTRRGPSGGARPAGQEKRPGDKR